MTRARLRALLRYDPQTGEFRWRKQMSQSIKPGDIAGGLNKEGYLKITITRRQYPAHQLAWLYMTGRRCRLVIDHKDANRANNRWDNLRCATRSQSSANRPPHRNNACGLKGAWRNGSGWCATIRKNGRQHYLGSFRTPQEAHAAYVKAARKLFGEFARTE